MQEKKSRLRQIHHIINMLLVLFFTVFLPGNSLSGQNPQDTVRPEQFHDTYLAEMIKTKIDSVRVLMGRLPLENDTILEKAALNHSLYLMNKRTITHGQPYTPKANVQKRVEYFGGEGYLCGENIAASFVQVKMADKSGLIYYNNTYAELANEFVRLWIKSAGHFKNLLNPDYNVTGIGVSLHPKTKRVVAVQVLAFKNKTD